jgi:transposase-like protein
MYARGLSTRDIEDLLRDRTGQVMISRSGVSQITEVLSQEYERFCSRDLAGYDVVYLFSDGVYESMRMQGGSNEAILCAWGILSNGQKVLLHLALGYKESHESWLDFFRNMVGRGLRMPLLVSADGAPGLIKAIQECFPQSRRQRCLAHKLRNIASKLPKEALAEVMPKVRAIFSQTDQKIALLYVAKVIEEYAAIYPAAMKCLQEDLEACLSFMDFPAGHHKHIRTTNLLERCFEEQRRRTKVIPRFLDEKSCLKLTYATLIRVSERWNQVTMSDYDLTLLRNLRRLYGWGEDQNGFISKKAAA